MQLHTLMVIVGKLRPLLSHEHYAIVGPSNYLWFQRFTSTAKNMASELASPLSLHMFLNNNENVSKALQTLPQYIDLSVYVVNRKVPTNNGLQFLTLSEYCRTHRLNVSELSLNAI